MRLRGGLACSTGEVSKIVVLGDSYAIPKVSKIVIEAHAVPGVDDGFYVIDLTGAQDSNTTDPPASGASTRLLATKASADEVSETRNNLVSKIVPPEEGRDQRFMFDPALTGAMIRRTSSSSFEVHAFRRGSPFEAWVALGVAPIGDKDRLSWRRVALVPALPFTVAADIVAWPLLALSLAISIPFWDV